MLLKDWLKKENITSYGLAKHFLHCSTSLIYQYINGKGNLSPGMALKIEALTKGEVTRLEVIYPQDFIEKRGKSEQLTFINKMGEG